jgi:hypothetical protein
MTAHPSDEILLEDYGLVAKGRLHYDAASRITATTVPGAVTRGV